MAKTGAETDMVAAPSIWRRLLGGLMADRVGLAAAAVTFYLFLALVPGIAVFVSVYGLATDPVAIADHVDLLAGFLPQAGLDLIHNELNRITSAQSGSLSTSLIVSLAISFWSANNAVRGLFVALNLAQHQEENRGLIHRLALTFGFTISIMIIGAIVLNLVIVLPVWLSVIGISQLPPLIDFAAAPLLVFVIVNVMIAALYRWGPSRRPVGWRFFSWGSTIATIMWMIVAFVVAFYLANWANYGAVYGSLSTVIGLMLWMYLSSFVVILGAELDAVLQERKAHDQNYS